jgi:2'-5' RNA ligase
MEPEFLNQFAVVAYIRGPLADFVNGLRCELTPGCPHQAHVTVLPPRSISIPVEQAIEESRQILSNFHPFGIRIGDVDLFPTTHTVKLVVADGVNELRTLHDLLGTGPFDGQDNYPYVPHVTLCKEDSGERMETVADVARRRWEQFGGYADLWIDTLTFVRQRADLTWADLADLPLGEPVSANVRR